MDDTFTRNAKRTFVNISSPRSSGGLGSTQTIINAPTNISRKPHFMEPLNRTPKTKPVVQTRQSQGYGPSSLPTRPKLDRQRSLCDSNPTFFSKTDLPFSKAPARRSKPRRTTYSSTLTVKEIEKLKHGFNLIDRDRDGLITKVDMNRFLKENNLETNFTDLAFKLFSHNGDTLNFDDFKEYVTVMTKMEGKPRIFYQVLFDFIDTDGSGGIDAHELVKFCDLIKEPITYQDAQKVIDELDDRRTGTLHFDALCKWFGV